MNQQSIVGYGATQLGFWDRPLEHKPVDPPLKANPPRQPTRTSGKRSASTKTTPSKKPGLWISWMDKSLKDD